MYKVVVVSVLAGVLVCGCEGLRFAPGEAQKRNAWVHNRTAALAADRAAADSASQQLRRLTGLSELQSRAFVAEAGLPKELPNAGSAEDVLSGANVALADRALSDAGARPDGWQAANAAIDLAIGVFALLGGAYGTRAVRFLREAKAKSNALKEVVLGNELFKKTNADAAQPFKDAHRNQSPVTRRLVAEMKG